MLAWLSVCERGADLLMALLMPLPLTISSSSKSRLVLPEWFCFTVAGLPRLSWKEGHQTNVVVVMKYICQFFHYLLAVFPIGTSISQFSVGSFLLLSYFA